jgi:hypothetical protein
LRIPLAVLLLAAAAGRTPGEEPPAPKQEAADVDELYKRLFPGTVPEEVGPVGGPQEETTREGLQLGPLRLRPSLLVSYVDGDNVFLDSPQPTRDRYFVVQPSLGLLLDALTLGAGTFRVSYEPRFRFGSSYEELLEPSHQVDAFLELPLTPGLTLRAADHFFVGTVETTEVDPGREYFFGLGQFGRNQVDAGLRLETGGRLALDLGGSINRVVFDEESTFFDYDQDRVNAALQYELTPNTRLGLAAGFERVPGTPERPESRMNARTYGLVVDGELAPLTTGRIELGYRDQENPDAAPGSTRYQGPYAVASIARETSRGGRVALGVSRSTPLSAFEENGFYVSTGVLLGLTFPLPLQLSASAGASYQWNDYRAPASTLGEPREDRIFGWSAGLGRPLTRWCFVRVDYRQDRRDSNVESLSNTAHGFIAQLGLGWFAGGQP